MAETGLVQTGARGKVYPTHNGKVLSKTQVRFYQACSILFGLVFFNVESE
jgi:hypothetical protein